MSFRLVIRMVTAYQFEQFSESSLYEKETVLPWTQETENLYETIAFNNLT